MMYVSKLNNFNLNISLVKGVTFVSGLFSEVLITMEKNVIFYITFILLLLFCYYYFTASGVLRSQQLL